MIRLGTRYAPACPEWRNKAWVPVRHDVPLFLHFIGHVSVGQLIHSTEPAGIKRFTYVCQKPCIAVEVILPQLPGTDGKESLRSAHDTPHTVGVE